MVKEKEQITLEKIIKEYNLAQEDALRLNYLVRDSELQTEQCNKLEVLKNEIKGYKYQAIDHKNEAEADLLFQLQCALNSLISVLNMWVSLKNQDYEKAWDKLVDAQEYVSVAMRVRKEHSHVNLHVAIEALHNIEKTIFPQWSYLSLGFLAKEGKCSICENLFSECEHIEGMIYVGQLCRRIDREMIKGNHVAIVTEPYDKRCIVRYISANDGRKRDYITWKVFEEKFGSGDSNVLHCSGRILRVTDGLDFD